MFNTGRLISVGFGFFPSCFEWELVVLICNTEKNFDWQRISNVFAFHYIFVKWSFLEMKGSGVRGFSVNRL